MSEAASRASRPVAAPERVEVVDILRGFALLGIWLAHVPGLSGWDYLSTSDQISIDPGADVALQYLRDTFVRGKFLSLFSLLFGFGFAIQYASAQRRDSAFASHFRRRQLGLLAIGIAHSAFWHGDILLTYALLGLLLIPIADWEPRRILRWSLGLFAMRAFWGLLMFAFAGVLTGIGDATVGDGQGGVDVTGSLDAVTAGYFSSEWTEMLLSNARFLRLKWLLVLYEGRLFSIGAFFLLGFAFGKWRIHERIAELAPRLKRMALGCGAIGLAGNLWLANLWSFAPSYPPTLVGMFTNLLYSVAVPALALAMAAGVALACTTPRGKRLLSPLAAPGRMALTTYLSQTALGIGIFYGVGFGMRGTISLAEGLAFALVVFAVQALLARSWLARFRFGPLEWAWRCFTYGRWLELRRSEAAAQS